MPFDEFYHPKRTGDRKIVPVSTMPPDRERLEDFKQRIGLKSSSTAYKRALEIALKVIQNTFPPEFNLKILRKKDSKGEQ